MRDPRNADKIRRPTLVNGEIFEKQKQFLSFPRLSAAHSSV